MFSLEQFEVFELILSYYFCGIDKLLIAFILEIPFSQTKVTSLCYYMVSLFMHVVATRKYGCNLDMKIIVRKLSIVLC